MERDGYRDELAAAHARIAVLEAELETLRPKRTHVGDLRAKRAALVAKQERGLRLTVSVKRGALVLAPLAFFALWMAGDLPSGIGFAAFLLFVGGVLPGKGAARTYEKGQLARLDEQIVEAERLAHRPPVRARVSLGEDVEEEALENVEEQQQPRTLIAP